MLTILGATIRDLLNSRRHAGADTEHLRSAMRWLCAAHDAPGDGGVSAGYDFLRRKWLPSYPEVTGYIIPTFLSYAAYAGEPALRERALHMAAWECGVRLGCGAAMSGHLGTRVRVPAVFDTGQVLLGWSAAYAASGREEFLRAAEQAADWLCAVQDPDGAWRRFPALQVRNNPNVYTTRVAWALAEASALLGREAYAAAARKNVAWALGRQNAGGWFSDNDFTRNDAPLTHTIAYAAEGILETGIRLGEESFVEPVARCCSALAERIRDDGFLCGRYDRDWKPKARWNCLAGSAQTAVVLLKLYRHTGDRACRDAAGSITSFLKSVQEPSCGDSGRAGGIKGSYPLYGGYEPYRYPSWAAKFFVDALLLEEGAAERRAEGLPPGGIRP